MALAKRAAKRVAPKTLEKMRQARAEKELERQNLEKLKTYNKLKEITLDSKNRSREFKESTQKNIEAIEQRIKQIEQQRSHLKGQPSPSNLFGESLVLEYRTKAKNKNTINARKELVKKPLNTTDGIIMAEKTRKDLLKRNERVLDRTIKKKERMDALYSLKRQERWLSGKNLGEFKEVHEKVIDYFFKNYEKGKLSYPQLQKIISQIDYCVKSAIFQNNLLIKVRSPESIDLHSKIVGKVLMSFAKDLNYGKMVGSLEIIKHDIESRDEVNRRLENYNKFLK